MIYDTAQKKTIEYLLYMVFRKRILTANLTVNVTVEFNSM